jgi:3-dehydroquinate dehydratase/shikimate dehydrogenase
VEDDKVKWAAYNTDYSAAIDSMLASLSQVKEQEQAVTTLQSRPTLILGAGGVARAIAYALHHEGALINIASRTAERSRKLAEELNCRYLEWTARHSIPAQIIVNCTPVGMHPKVDENPIHPSFLMPGQLVFDTVYTPETTLLIKEARSRGCQIVTGIDFFVRQAAAQFRLFTGKEPPVEAMYKLVKRALSPITMKEETE